MKQSKSRLEAISDSIFAFAATLVVVSLDVPESFVELKENLWSFGPFAVSFGALVLIWKVHYNYYRRASFIDNWVVALNMILMFIILFFVYPLKFLANVSFRNTSINFNELSELFALYGFGFTMIFLCVSLLYAYQGRDKHQVENQDLMKFYARHFGIFVGIGLLSTLLAMFKVGIMYGFPGFAYALLGPICWWHGVKYGKEI